MFRIFSNNMNEVKTKTALKNNKNVKTKATFFCFFSFAAHIERKEVQYLFWDVYP
jgi:hypothetical protein